MQQETGAQGEEGSRSILYMMHRMVAGLTGTVERHRFALAAFLIPLTMRPIPEIIAGPYPIGWDTVAVVGYYSGCW